MKNLHLNDRYKDILIVNSFSTMKCLIELGQTTFNIKLFNMLCLSNLSNFRNILTKNCICQSEIEFMNQNLFQKKNHKILKKLISKIS